MNGPSFMNGRGLKIALGVSIALNVFIVGGIVGAIYMHRTASPAGPPLMRAGDGLSSQDRDAFRRMLETEIPVVRPLQDDARQARRQAMDALQQPTFDRVQVGALMARARADEDKARGVMEGAVLDFAAKLPADERASLVRSMRRRDHMHFHRGPPPFGAPGGPPAGPQAGPPG
jgi:uncharacterized membrane protein